ncbi:MAG: LapA family protein [Patescibacteria group bacterium]
MFLSLTIGFILGAAVIIFALQNPTVVALHFLGFAFESSLALVVIIAFAAGVGITALVSLPSALGHSFHIRRLQKDKTLLENDLHALRNEREVAQTIVVTPAADTHF